jgi:hypothetical protein
MSLLERNLDKIDWSRLSANPNAMHLLEQNPDKIDWHKLSGNPSAIHLLEKSQDKIDWVSLSSNPSIFEKRINYKFLKDRVDVIREELMMRASVQDD